MLCENREEAMARCRRVFFVLVLFVFCNVTDASADQITLANGDIISGKVETVSAGSVRIVTDYAGAITVDFRQVANLEIEENGRISLQNGDVITGRIVSMSGESVAIASPVLQDLTIPRDLFKGFNVPVEEVSASELEQTRETLKKTEEKLATAEAKVENLSSISKLWSGSLSLGTQLRRGNTDSSDARFDAIAIRKAPREELSLRFYSDYGETDGETDTNEIFGEVKLKVFRTDRFYLFGLTNMEYDEMENLDLRAQVFGGPGYIFIKTDKTNLLGEIGAGLTGEFFDEEEGDDEENLEASLRLNAEWRQKLFDNAEFFQGLILYPSLSEFGDYRLRSESTLVTPLSEQWAIKLSLVDDYDSSPENKDTKKNDLRFVSSIQYTY